MSTRRLLAGALLLAGARLAIAQNDPDSTKLTNWPVVPLWAAPQSLALEKLKEQGVVDPMAVEAVPTPPLPLIGINPCRIVDTRGNGFTGAYGPPALFQGAPRNFTLTGQCGIPGAAQAVSLNITVTNTEGPGFILIYPQGGAQPNVSTLNYVAGQTIANAAVVPLGTAGGITVIAGVSGTDLIIDTNGYYAPQTVVNTVNSLSGAVTLAAGSNVSITPSGQTLTIANTAPASWRLSGNAGTTPGTNFLGTTDNQALELKVNGERALRLETDPFPGTYGPNIIGGFLGNFVTGGKVGATIAGGGQTGLVNSVTEDFGTVGGGWNNAASGYAAVVDGGRGNTASGNQASLGGGQGNTASGLWSTVGGGSSNQATGQQATVGGGGGNSAGTIGTIGGGVNNSTGFYGAVGGGSNNIASGTSAAIGGGVGNVASAYTATVPGGSNNVAAGEYSLAAGRQAKANHDGTFVWGDATPMADVASTGVNQFIVRASGGIWLGTTSSPSLNIASDFLNTSTGAHLTIGGIWTNASDRALKENFQAVNRRDVLSRLASLPVASWNYRAEGAATRHLGPTAQDFAAAFGLGGDDRSIGTVDADGVSLTAIQALYEIVKEKVAEIESLKVRLSKLEAKID